MRGEAATRAGDDSRDGARNHQHDRDGCLMAIPEARPVSSLLCCLVFRQGFPGYRFEAEILECVGKRILSRDGDQGIEGHRVVPSSKWCWQTALRLYGQYAGRHINCVT